MSINHGNMPPAANTCDSESNLRVLVIVHVVTSVPKNDIIDKSHANCMLLLVNNNESGSYKKNTGKHRNKTSGDLG